MQILISLENFTAFGADVNITIDKEYTLGVPYLQNQNEIGHGYEDAGVTVNIQENANDLAFCGANGS
jgi:hypothetical protein